MTPFRPYDRLVPLVNGVPDWERQGAVDAIPTGGTVRLRVYDHKRGRSAANSVEVPILSVRPAPLYAIGDRVRCLPGSVDFGEGTVVGVESNGWEINVEWDNGIIIPDEDWRAVRPADGCTATQVQETDPMAKRTQADNGYDTAAGAAGDAAVADRKPRRRRRVEQEPLIDTDHPEDKALLKAAREYAEVRDERMALTKTEIEKRTLLLDMMHARGESVYEHGDLRIEIAINEKVRVKIDDEDGDEDGDD